MTTSVQSRRRQPHIRRRSPSATVRSAAAVAGMALLLAACERDTRYVALTRKLPVYIVYLTAFTRDGELFFGNDLYARDDALVGRVASGALPSAQASAALDSLGRLATR